MTKQEFEKATGKEVTDETFKKWYDLFLESGLDKYQFCKTVKRAVKAERKINYIIAEDHKVGGDLYSVHVYDRLDKNGRRGFKTLKKMGVYYADELDRMKRETGIDLETFNPNKMYTDYTEIECAKWEFKIID